MVRLVYEDLGALAAGKSARESAGHTLQPTDEQQKQLITVMKIKNRDAGRKGSLRTVFISYAHKDRHFLPKLQAHLAPLEREFQIDVWSDVEIAPGSLWETEIQRGVDSARAAILLVSAHFLASEFICEQELPALLQRAKESSLTILPIIVSECGYAESRLKDVQAVNSPARGLRDLEVADQERVFARVAKIIRGLLGAAERHGIRPISEWGAEEQIWPQAPALAAANVVDLQALRAAHYTRLWRLTQVLPKWPPSADVTYERLFQFSKELQHWYFAGGGMYLSELSYTAYASLQEALARAVEPRLTSGRMEEVRTASGDAPKSVPASAVVISTGLYRSLRLKCSNLRRELTKDLESNRRRR